MKAKRSNYAGLIALLLIGAAGVFGVAVYIKKTPEAQNVPSTLQRDSGNRATSRASEGPASQSGSAQVLTPKSKGGDLSFDQSTESVPKGTDPIVYAVNRYLQNSHVTKPEAKVLGVRIDPDGVAEFDCTEAMETSVGSSDEQTLIQGISKTLSQFPNIKKAKFLVSGEVIDTWGNVDISNGIDVTNTPDATPPDGSSTQTGA